MNHFQARQAFLAGYLSKVALNGSTQGQVKDIGKRSAAASVGSADGSPTAKAKGTPPMPSGMPKQLGRVNAAQPSSAPPGAGTQNNNLLTPTNFSQAPSSAIASQQPPTAATINTAGKGAPVTAQTGMQQASNTSSNAVAANQYKVAPMNPVTGQKVP